jgi:hypothetical protein
MIVGKLHQPFGGYISLPHELKSFVVVAKIRIDEKLGNKSLQTAFASAIFVDIVHGRFIEQLTIFFQRKRGCYP